MTAWQRVIELSISDAEVAKLMSIARSRTEPASRVERARILLGYREDPSFFAVARALGLHHQTVRPCVERALAYGPVAALDDGPRRDPEFKEKMAEVLCVYRQVKILKETAVASKKKPSDAVAIISYDEKPGIQAAATTAPDLRPEPGVHATFAREHEYKRHGTVSLLAGIHLVLHALVKDCHRSREFIKFLKLLDGAYPARMAIKLILDNHSAHISKEMKAWLAQQPPGRFEFTFTPKHGSWLNLV
jgi:DDE superfamily endonuclease